MPKISSNLFFVILLVIIGVVIGILAHFVALQAFGVNNPSRIVQLTSLIVMPGVLLYTFKFFGFKFSQRGLVVNNLWVDFSIVVAIIILGVLSSIILEYVGTQFFGINTEISDALGYFIMNSIGVGGTMIYLLKEKEDKTRS